MINYGAQVLSQSANSCKLTFGPHTVNREIFALKIFCVKIFRRLANLKNIFFIGSGRPSRGLRCLDIAETLADSLACSQSIKIASVQDRVTIVYTYSLHTCS